jgi:hypothetical protein
MKHIAEITISTKKGHSQLTRWHVSQSRPYPDLERLEWRNTAGLIPNYNNQYKAPTIGTEYRCFLLRSDFDPATATGNRSDFAGFESGLSYDSNGNRVHLPENPGAIELRGKSLGEMCVTFGNNPEWPEITVRGYGGTATTAEREWMETAIIPALRAYIQANAATLKAEAVASLKADTESRISEARRKIDDAEKKMAEVIAKL